uniref:Uncharacterized protein n=1 Tax=Ascaris lumbricoides TaxID=6252 RepID=A0A0M3I7K7_ASCLU
MLRENRRWQLFEWMPYAYCHPHTQCVFDDFWRRLLYIIKRHNIDFDALCNKVLVKYR